ncbi:ferrous iron transport protein B [bacterium BMS3Bbin06]|nr:ferrous iron transport protein B [bacterium BMS3Abin08]GBE34502.1 ferrous iron transport protein B [bacterium BMS3Bbin06]
MECHSRESVVPGAERIVLVGTPNVGKSVIFGLLTGKYAAVSNYPGTTVEISQGNINYEGTRYLVIDTPGVNSLMPMSEDERVTRDILLQERPFSVIQVADSKNLKRALLITLQLAEMELPVVLDLNMEDEARDRGLRIDKEGLGELLCVAVVGTVAPRRKGFRELKETILHPRIPVLRIKYNETIEEYLERIERIIPDAPMSRRSIALMLLSGDESLREWLKNNLSDESIDEIERLRDECQSKFNRPIMQVIHESRIRAIDDVMDKVLTKYESGRSRISPFLESVTMHPVWGIPVLIIVLLAFYEFVGVFGAGTLVDFFEKFIFGRYINPMVTKVVDVILPFRFFRDMLVGEYGIVTVALTYSIAIILPITTTFFIAFSILEDSGYLPRLAVMSNKVFNMIGLNGKAILPMILGLGCGTMAVMTTRILETKRDRIIATFLLALAIPCSAQIGVILGMLGALSFKGMGIWIATIITVLFVSGFLASKVVPGDKTEFFMEIPPMRLPKLSNVMIKTVGRIEWYLKEAVPLFIIGTLVLFFLSELHLLAVLERMASPLVKGFLGLPEKTTGFFILGFLRRDYGAAGLFSMAEAGELDHLQSLISLVTITLFIPCLANFFMIVKERGMKVAVAVSLIVFFLAFLVGGVMNLMLRNLGVVL